MKIARAAVGVSGRAQGRGTSLTATIAGVLALAAGVGGAGAGTDNTSSDRAARQGAVREGRAVRPAVVDLGAQAQERRDGQVLPGDPPTKRATPSYVRDQGAEALRQETEPAIEMSEPAPVIVTRPVAPAATPTPAQPIIVTQASEPGTLFGVMVAPSEGHGGVPYAGEPAPAASIEHTHATTPTAPAVSQVPARPVPSAAVAAAEEESGPAPAASFSSAAIEVPSRSAQGSADGSGSPRAVAAASVGLTFARLEGNAGNVRYRMLDDATGLRGSVWVTPTLGEQASGRIEIETATGVHAVLVMGEDVKLVLAPMSRIRLESQLTMKGGAEMAIELTKGEVDIEPLTFDEMGLSRSPVRVRTPDKSYTTRVPIKVSFDASKGTTQQVVVPTE